MAWAKDTQIKAWSFSRYSTYTKCPLSAKLAYLDKIKQPQSEPMRRGDEIHKMAEAFVKGKIKKLPDELSFFPNFFAKMRKLYKKDPGVVVVEETWTFRRDWTRTVWNDWNGAWLRVKLDCAWMDETTVRIVDFKTGKFSPQYGLDQYLEQVDLYAMAALIVYADVGPELRVIPSLYYLDHEIIFPEPGAEKVYAPSDLPSLKKTWEKRTKPMLADKQFAAKPNSLCGWCHYRAANKENGGGQCRF